MKFESKIEYKNKKHCELREEPRGIVETFTYCFVQWHLQHHQMLFPVIFTSFGFFSVCVGKNQWHVMDVR